MNCDSVIRLTLWCCGGIVVVCLVMVDYYSYCEYSL